MPAGSAKGERRGGRQKGTPNKRTAAVKEAAAETLRAAQASAAPDTLFDGDAHALMVLVYQDKTLPLDMRLDAAAKAIRYEKPALAAVDVSGNQTLTVHTVADTPLTAEQWLDEVRPPH